VRIRHLRLPKDRIGVAIGSRGEIKEEIEHRTGTKLTLESKTGEAVIKSDEENPMGVLTAQDILTAIGRGFSPSRAFRLFDDDVYLEIIDITAYTGRSDKARDRLKGRIIGEGGKTRRLIEEVTGASLSVYGKTVAMIGTPEQLGVVREAVHMLLRGIPHSAVYRFLERKRREIKKEVKLWRS